MRYVRWFQEIQAGEFDIVSGKDANLDKLARAGFPGPLGFCLITAAWQTIEKVDRYPEIERVLDKIDLADPEDVPLKTAAIQNLVKSQAIPEALKDEILISYRLPGRKVSVGGYVGWVYLREESGA